MDSLFYNGGIIGPTLDFFSDERYIVIPPLASPVVVGTSTSSTANTITLPTGLQANDLVIICSVSDSTAQALPSGFTNGQNGVLNSTNYRWSYRVMGTVPITTATGLSTSTSVHIAFAFRGVSLTTPVVTTAVSTNADVGMPNPPSITTTSDETTIIAVGFLDDDSVAASVTAPSGYTLLRAAQNGATVMAARKALPLAGTEDPGVFGGTGSDSWVGATFALLPTQDPVNGNFKNSGLWPLGTVYDKILPLPRARFLTSLSSNTIANSYTFSAVPLGNPSNLRKIIVTIAYDDATTTSAVVNSFTIAGVAATLLRRRDDGSLDTAIYIAEIPTGDTGNIVINLSANTRGFFISVYEVTGNVSLTPKDTDGAESNGGTLGYNLTGTKVGFSIAVSLCDTNFVPGVATWTGISKDSELYFGSNNTASSASENYVYGNGTYNFSSNITNEQDGSVGCAVFMGT
jgi:hypothetical protein